MHFLRKSALVLASALLPIFLFTFGLTFSLYQVFGTSDHIKGALEKSGVYNTFISDVLANAKSGEGQNEGIPVDRPEVKNIIQNAASPEFLQQQTEGFLNGLYAWVRGESKQLNLEINLTDAKAKLVDGLTTYANDRLATLPACSGQISNEFDALNAECVPPGTNRAAAVEKIRQEINGGEFLKDPVITQDNIKNKEGKPLEEQMKAIPGVYSQLVTAIWVSGILALLLAVAIVFLRTPWRAGLKRVGIVFISVGASSAALAWAGGFLTSKLADSLAKSSDGNIQASLAKIVSLLTNDLRTWWLGYGLIILVLGIATLITLRFIKTEEGADKSIATDHLDKKTKPGRQDESPKPPAPTTKTV